jgi:transposase-like protein
MQYEIGNLILTSIWEHPNKYHREDFGQVCEPCGSINVRRIGLDRGKQIFRCNSCRLKWSINKTISIDYGQICRNCGSKYVVKRGMRNGKQRFQCRDCKKRWSVPMTDLVVRRIS